MKTFRLKRMQMQRFRLGCNI